MRSLRQISHLQTIVFRPRRVGMVTACRFNSSGNGGRGRDGPRAPPRSSTSAADSCVEQPPALLTGEDSVNGFLWWSHLGAFRSYDTAAIERITELLAGALLYADGHSAPTCSSVLGHHKILPEKAMPMNELDYPVAVITSMDSRRDALARRRSKLRASAGDSFPSSEEQASSQDLTSRKETQSKLSVTSEGQVAWSPLAVVEKGTFVAEESKVTASTAANHTLQGSNDILNRGEKVQSGLPKTSEIREERQRTLSREERRRDRKRPTVHAEEFVPMVLDVRASVSAPLPSLSNTHRMSLVQEVLLIREGSERMLQRHFVSAVNILLSAGPCVVVPCDMLEDSGIVESVFGTQPPSRSGGLRGGATDGLVVSSENFTALLVALVATRTTKHAVVFECIRTCLICGIVFPEPVVRRLAMFLSSSRVGHANAAARMAADLFIEVDGLHYEMSLRSGGEKGGFGSSLARRLLQEHSKDNKPSASFESRKAAGVASSSEMIASMQKTKSPAPAANEEEVVLCSAISNALSKGAIAEVSRLLDDYVPCIVPPSRTSLVSAIAFSNASSESRRYLLSVLRGRCTAIERFSFDTKLADILRAGDPNVTKAANTAMAARVGGTSGGEKVRGSKLQRSLSNP